MMANRKKNNDLSRSVSRNAIRKIAEGIFSSSSSSEESEVTTGCRSCRNTSKEHYTCNRIETEPLTASHDQLRRELRNEQNPLSFKHFLKSNSLSNYQNTGARPKVYSPSASSPHSLDKDGTVYTRNPTELPDFVQDHLVIEQCYLNNQPNQSAMPEVDNLPDFTLNSVEQRQNRIRHDAKKIESSVSCDVPFDLTKNVRRTLPPRNYSLQDRGRSVHLDLPPYNRSSGDSSKRPDNSDANETFLTGFPSDLPLPDLPTSESDSSVDATSEFSRPGETGIPKSLPDFLNDGPIHNRTALSADSGIPPNNSESTERRLLSEIERLQHELEASRKDITEKNRRIDILESELVSRKGVQQRHTRHLGQTEQYDEDSLNRNTNSEVSGESTVATLKKEIKSLTTEISLLRVENKKLRAKMTTADSENFTSPNVDRTVRILASDLRNAASSVEISLRQLMSGVENLRVLASTLENVDRIEDRTKDFLPDIDKDNDAGPAV